MSTIPTTPEQADVWFRCERLRCSMAGSACAARWARAQSVGAQPWGKFGIEGDDCRGCPLGAARHKLGAHLRAPQLTQIEAPRPAAPQTDEEDTMIPSALDRVRAYVFEQGSVTAADVAAGVDCSLSTVHKHLHTLMGEGAVEREQPDGGGAYRYYPVHRNSAPAPPPAPQPPTPLDPDPPAAPPPAAEVVELQPEVSTEAVPEPPERLPSEVAADAAADAYIIARDRLSRACERAGALLDGDEVEVIACAAGLRQLATALQAAAGQLEEARAAVLADRYEAILSSMGAAA